MADKLSNSVNPCKSASKKSRDLCGKNKKWPCTFLRIDFAEFTAPASSIRVVPQHNELTLMAAPFPA